MLQARRSGTLYRTVSETRLSAAAASGNYLRRTSSTAILSTLSAVEMHYMTARYISLALPVTVAWNALPDDLRDPSLSADIFRKRLKTHLFRNALGHLVH